MVVLASPETLRASGRRFHDDSHVVSAADKELYRTAENGGEKG